MNILFHSNQISIRGTEIALYDYAIGNQTILKGLSFIACPKDGVFDQSVLEKFNNSFIVLLYENKLDLESFITENKIELLYQITSGEEIPLLTKIVPTFSHCVFTTKSKAAKYNIPISSFLNKYYRTNNPVLPHIIKQFPGIKEDLRNILNIPKNATVFGGYGGKEQFDLMFAKQAISDIAKDRKDIYFIFLNFTPFNTHCENIIFLPKNSNIEYKEKFINSCDAMIHGRSDGETFGLSIAEFSVKNKVVITWKPNFIHNFKYKVDSLIRYMLKRKHRYATAHLNYLGNKAITYSNYITLKKILNNFDKNKYKTGSWDCYSEKFSEDVVMEKFNKIIHNKCDQKLKYNQ